MMLIAYAVPLAFLAASAAESKSFTVYSDPVNLRYGQVHNRLQYNKEAPLELPADVVDRYASGERQLAITGFDVDMIRVNSAGQEVPVLLSDHYVHHYILYFGRRHTLDRVISKAQQDGPHGMHMLTGCHGMTGKGFRRYLSQLDDDEPSDGAAFGSASGAEFRHNPQRFEAPFRVILKQPEIWAPTLHIINTNRHLNKTSDGALPDPVSPLLECPCTPQRRIDIQAGTIDGRAPDPPIQCSKDFAATGNPSCHLSTYVGGWRCCEHDVFLVDTDEECKSDDCADKPVDSVTAKFTFYYEDATPETRAMEGSACCDVTADRTMQGNENIEYDIPQCPAGTPPQDCIHVAVSQQPVGYFNQSASKVFPLASDLVDLVFAAPHLHWAALSIELLDPATNRTLCAVHRSPDDRSGGIWYGHSSTPGDEAGYLTGLDVCRWGPQDAPRFRRDHLLQIRAVYNASMMHTGVMSLWLMQVAKVPQSEPDVLV